MKKLFIFLVIIILFSGCKERMAEYEYQSLLRQNNALRYEIKEQRTLLDELKILPVDTVYLITLEVKQVTYTVDINEHLKNRMNTIKFTIPVSKEFYALVSIGNKLSSEMKIGSAIIDGDFSRLNIKVIDKQIRSADNEP